MRTGIQGVLSAPIANAQQQLNTSTTQTLALDPGCVALFLSARSQNVIVTFDNTTPAANNGVVIIAGAQPVYVPLGYHAEANHNLKALGVSGGGFLDVMQVA